MTVEKTDCSGEYEKHFRNALHNYIPVLNIIDGIREKYPNGAMEVMPGKWNDPLELYGCYLQELMVPGLGKKGTPETT